MSKVLVYLFLAQPQDNLLLLLALSPLLAVPILLLFFLLLLQLLGWLEVLLDK